MLSLTEGSALSLTRKHATLSFVQETLAQRGKETDFQTMLILFPLCLYKISIRFNPYRLRTDVLRVQLQERLTQPRAILHSRPGCIVTQAELGASVAG